MSEKTQAMIKLVCDELKELLLKKNLSYGDAVANPIRIFSKESADEQVNVRIDDKLNRIKQGHEYAEEDTLMDLTGYLILKMVNRRLEEIIEMPEDDKALLE